MPRLLITISRVSNYNLKIIALIHISSVLAKVDDVDEAILFLDNQINKYSTLSYSKKGSYAKTNIFVE